MDHPNVKDGENEPTPTHYLGWSLDTHLQKVTDTLRESENESQ